MDTSIALVDCENFYVSCERAFRPDLEGRPVVVLSNNDGCVISRSNEVRAAGIGMAVPFFQVREQLEEMDAAVLSSNYTLYADLSRRVMSILEEEAADCAVYSIDEAFLRFPDLPPHELEETGRRIRRRVLRATGIPVRFGFGPTKTLAKLSSSMAKGEPDGVYALPDELEREEVLAAFPVEEIWGIGRSRTKLLHSRGVETARELRDLPDTWVRRHMTVVGLRTVWELRGTECMPLDEAPDNRKSLVRSRSFSKKVYEQSDLAEAIATRVSRAAEKLREEELVARGLQVFVTTKRFSKGKHYSNGAAATLPRPTNFTPELVRAAKQLLGSIFRKGFAYKKAGVLLFDLSAEVPEQGHLFIQRDPREQALMAAMDRINATLGRGSVRVAASGIRQSWEMQQSRRSPRYTTCWDELPIVKAG